MSLAGARLVQQSVPRIDAPVTGATLRGVVEISGASQVDGFVSAELAYATTDGDTWFVIAQSDQPVAGGLLARWDTTAILDGDYRLRLLVLRRQGTPLETQVQRLRVRNDAAVVTAQVAATQAPLALLSTPTALPANPAQIGAWQLGAAVTQGVVITFFIFLVLGLYAWVRRAARGA